MDVPKILSIMLLGCLLYIFMGTASAVPANITMGGSGYATIPMNGTYNCNFTSDQAITLTTWNFNGDNITNTTNNSMTFVFTDDPGFKWVTAYITNVNGVSNTLEWRISVNRQLATEHEGYFDEKNYNNFIDNLSEWNSTGMIEVSVSPFTDLIGRSFYIILFVLPFVLMWMMQKKITIPTVMALITGCLFIGFIPDQYRAFLTYAVILGFAACFYWIGKERN